MKQNIAKQKAVDAIEKIIQAAKELAKAEQEYYKCKTHKLQKGNMNDC